MSVESFDQWKHKNASQSKMRLRMMALPAAWQVMANDDQRYRDTPPALLHCMVVLLAIVQFGFVHRVIELL